MSYDPRDKVPVPSELWGDLMRIVEMKGPLHEGGNDLGTHTIYDGYSTHSAHIQVKVKEGRIANIWITPRINNPHNAHHDVFVDRETGDWMMRYASSNMDWR